MVSRISADRYRFDHLSNFDPMKKHAIIPIFIPHLGCPMACVFCNQRRITARSSMPTANSVRETCESWLSTLGGLDPRNIEIAFYGGSFTGIDPEARRAYLAAAHEFVSAGRVASLHISTRPDYINEAVLSELERYDVRTVELGCQSFDDEVLRLSRRGHSSDDIRRACAMIKKRGLRLGIQLMIGLPGDSYDACIYSARQAALIGPELVRLYPTVLIDDTELLDMYRRGDYVPLTQEEAVRRTREMYLILEAAGAFIMRVGLKSTDIIGTGEDSAVKGGTYHPAFRSLVESTIAREEIEKALPSMGKASDVTVYSSPAWLSNAVGHGGMNRDYFRKSRPDLRMSFRADPALSGRSLRVSW